MAREKEKHNKVLVGLSGGVDSAVSAHLLLQQGYEVEGVFMKNWSATTGLLKADCPWLSDRQDALRVAGFLGIPLHTVDFEKAYQSKVMSYFFKEYKAGRTPNPDVMCNKEIKFGLLYDWARKRGFDFLATGHYARVIRRGNFQFPISNFQSGTRDKRSVTSDPTRLEPRSDYYLARSADEFKDQTYFIYNLKQEQLPHIMFPIGGMKKDAVKKLARKIGLPNASRKESMGICFVGKIRLKDFLEQKLNSKPGKIIDQTGKLIGKHKGLHNYTLGQRQGIAVGNNGPFFVTRKDLKNNTLYVTSNPDDSSLLVKRVVMSSIHFIGARGKGLEVRTVNTRFSNSTLIPQPSSLTGRYRHQGQLIPLTLTKTGKHFEVEFKTPQKAVASGQSLVLYDGKICVGGGIIA